MFKKNIHYLIILPAVMVVLANCKKWDDYKKYTADGEKTYPQTPSNVSTYPGNGRIMLAWKQGIDTRVKKYIISWNNRADSMVVDASAYKPGDTVKKIITNLPETNYSFTIYSVDDQNNRSVPSLIPAVNVYGAKYQAALLNRPVNKVDYSGDTKMLTVIWNKPDTINLNTQIWYTDTLGIVRTTALAAGKDTIMFPWQVASGIYYQSSYMPVSSAIDSFAVLNKDSIIVKYVPVPKALWKKINLPNDIDADSWGTSLNWIWDGKGGGYPQIYHSDGGSIPHHFTIDLGGLYTLNKVEEIGRTDCACHNVTKFEVWGIADITGAATTLPGDDAGWVQESINKGWTLLKEVVRTDDGTDPFSTTIADGFPQVRYIRIRVTETLDGGAESHMSELSFWYKP